MAVKDILQIGSPALLKKSVEIDFKKDPVTQYVKDLSDTLRCFQQEKGLGRAIAGPQIGCMKRIIRMESEKRSLTMVNPKIVKKSLRRFEVWDSCFSADVAFFGKTLRHREISVSYYNEVGERQIEIFSDDLSELFQHEIDHLDGILFTDRIIDNQIIMRGEWEKL